MILVSDHNLLVRYARPEVTHLAAQAVENLGHLPALWMY
jgi:hypothetical protein